MARDIEFDELKSIPVNGKYNVHPAEIPVSKDMATINNCTESTDSQKARLLSRGVAKSTKPSKVGMCKFPIAAITPGIINKKTIPSCSIKVILITVSKQI